VLQESQHAGGDQLRGRLVAGHQQLLDHVQQFGHLQPLARPFAGVEASLHEVAEQVVARIVLALAASLGHVVLHLHPAPRDWSCCSG
jgi:hypothetical protein